MVLESSERGVAARSERPPPVNPFGDDDVGLGLELEIAPFRIRVVIAQGFAER